MMIKAWTRSTLTLQLVAVWGAATLLLLVVPSRAQTPNPQTTPPTAPDESKANQPPAKPEVESPADTPQPAPPTQSQAPPTADNRFPDREPALKGYCPAAYLLQGKAVKGDPAFRSTYAGEVYHLSSAEAKQQFDTDPEKFLPQFAGFCTTALGGPYRNRLPCDPAVFDVREGKVYLFSCERAKKAYDKQPGWFIASAAHEFALPAINGFSPVAYQSRNKPIPGRVEYQTQYRGKVYWFPNDAERAMFLREPERYVPAYDGFCAEGVGRGSRYPGHAEEFAVHDGRTYLFYDSKARITFLVNPTEAVKQADAQWATLKDQPRLP